MKAPKYIKVHPQYTADDYAYLRAKGWTNQEIKQRWNKEHAAGCRPCHWDSSYAQQKLNNVLNRNK